MGSKIWGWTSHPDNPDARRSLGTLVPEGPSKFSLGTIIPEGPSRFSLGTIVPEGPSRFRANGVHSDCPECHQESRGEDKGAAPPPSPHPPAPRTHAGRSRGPAAHNPDSSRSRSWAGGRPRPGTEFCTPSWGTSSTGSTRRREHRSRATCGRPPLSGRFGSRCSCTAGNSARTGRFLRGGGEGRRAGGEGDNRENSGINSLGGVLDKSSTSARARESGPRAPAEPPGLPTRQSREAGGTRRKGDLHAQQSPLQSPEMPPGPIHASCSPGADHTPKTWSGGLRLLGLTRHAPWFSRLERPESPLNLHEPRVCRT